MSLDSGQMSTKFLDLHSISRYRWVQLDRCKTSASSVLYYLGTTYLAVSVVFASKITLVHNTEPKSHVPRSWSSIVRSACIESVVNIFTTFHTEAREDLRSCMVHPWSQLFIKSACVLLELLKETHCLQQDRTRIPHQMASAPQHFPADPA
jgi:hypothetical protein